LAQVTDLSKATSLVWYDQETEKAPLKKYKTLKLGYAIIGKCIYLKKVTHENTVR
jgi:hypothetical protein